MVAQSESLSMANAVSRNGNRLISYESIPKTMTHKENMNISVLDVGNPLGIRERSRFYDDEVLEFFSEVNKL